MTCVVGHTVYGHSSPTNQPVGQSSLQTHAMWLNILFSSQGDPLEFTGTSYVRLNLDKCVETMHMTVKISDTVVRPYEH